MRLPRLAVMLLALAALGLLACEQAPQDTGWVIRSFHAEYTIKDDATVDVVEDIGVDFLLLQRHGIFRGVPERYRYDGERDRLITISNVSVTDGGEGVPFELIPSDGGLRIKIGDPNRFVTGEQRYVIRYTITGGLNPLPDADELFINVTGNDWPVPILRADAIIRAPSPVIQEAACYEGPTRSDDPCESRMEADSARYVATRELPAGSGLTAVASLEKGAVPVPVLVLVATLPDTSLLGRTRSFLGVSAPGIAAGAVLSVLLVGLVGYQWWRIGRDRWYGDTYYRMQDAPQEEPKGPFAHKTVVVEYTPPDIAEDGRRLRPAEVGLLLDERADTLDVSATIVDLAVRGYVQIQETADTGIFGAFRAPDYMLGRLKPSDGELLPYERKLLDSLFEDGDAVKMSELKFKFHEDLTTVKELLYRNGTNTLRHFPRDPETVRGFYQGAGIGTIVAGGAVAAFMGYVWGAALLALPIAVAGLALVAIAPSMPRRTAQGWEAYRRCLGFRLYMVTAETDRQRFAEEENIFHEYLPYAIVMGCVDKWAKAFEGLELQPESGYYIGRHGFSASQFAGGLRGFSSSVTSVMAATPGSSGGSGFSGGFSGGGIGGGGGGSW